MKTVNVIEAIFFAALEKKDATERTDYLDKACVGDADLRRCVEKLLNAQPRVGEFMQAPAAGLPQSVDSPSDERPGTILGPYKLLHDIGEGGMGTVWMAEQCEPVRRRVALKVIKPGMDSRQVLARFEAERQALALMDHPNIAKVLDAGSTAAGRPYFVMELVKGQPITEFCDKNKLTPRERLELFVPVCHAIQHAHQKGVIHRDIKPSNVLVALYDGKPVPKVIDFGVAKATAEPLTTKTLFTRHGQVVGTFEYMSPEQATLDQVDVDTRSDVYSLGVLLYELLTGTTPLEKDRLRDAGLAEVLRLIREEEPPKPSTRLTSSPGLLAMAAAQRKTESQKLPRVVRGELDWIVMKALDKDRDRRFPTPNGLARDIERYLKGEEVTACPPTKAYRLRKWARKHKVAFTMTSAVAAALLVGIALASWQAVRATNAERGTAAALDDALRIGNALDASLGETKAANAQIRAAQEQQRANQYAWDMRGLSLIWESGNTVEAKRLLERQPEYLRGFEWRYWNNVMHSEVLSDKLWLPPPPRSRSSSGGLYSHEWIFSGDGTRIALIHWPTRIARARPEEPKEKEKEKEREAILTVWEIATRKVVRTHRFAVAPENTGFDRPGSGAAVFARLSHDGKRVLLTQQIFSETPSGEFAPRGTHLEVFDVERDKVIFNRSFEKQRPFFIEAQVNWSQDGRTLVAGLQTRERERKDADGLRLSKLVGSEIKVFDLDADDQERLTIPDVDLRYLSADGTRIVSVRPNSNETGSFLTVTPQKVEHKVWDADTGKELSSFEASSTRFRPDGKEMFDVILADGNKSDRLLLKSYSAETGKERLSVPLPFPASTINLRNDETQKLERVFAPFVAMVFSRDSSQLLVSNRAFVNGTGIEVGAFIDVEKGKILATLDNASGRPTPLQPGFNATRTQQPSFFTADGKQLVLADDNVIRTFDATTGKPVLTLRGHDDAIVASAEGADGRLWSVETDGTLKQWSLQRPEPLQLAAEPLSTFPRANPFTASTDGAWVARVHVEQSEKPDEEKSIVEVWDTAGKEKAKVFQKVGVPRGYLPGRGGSPDPTSVALSADGRRVAMIRQAAYPPPAKDEKNDAAKIAPPDLTVWDVASGEEIYQTELRNPAGTDLVPIFSARPMLFSPDGETVGVVQPVFQPQMQYILRIFDIKNRREKQAINFGDATTQSVRFSPDGQRVAAALQVRRTINLATDPNGKVVLYEVATGTQREIAALAMWGSDSKVAFSPDGTRLLVAYQTFSAYQINLYDTATGKQTGSLYTPDRSVRVGGLRLQLDSTGPVFSPDGRRVASITYSPQTAVIKVWETESGKDLLSLPAPPVAVPSGPGRGTMHLAFTPDNNRLVAVRTIGRPAFAPKGFTTEARTLPPITVTTYDATPRGEGSK